MSRICGLLGSRASACRRCSPTSPRARAAPALAAARPRPGATSARRARLARAAGPTPAAATACAPGASSTATCGRRAADAAVVARSRASMGSSRRCAGSTATSRSRCGSRRRATLWLARDRLGVRPLYYAAHRRRLRVRVAGAAAAAPAGRQPRARPALPRRVRRLALPLLRQPARALALPRRRPAARRPRRCACAPATCWSPATGTWPSRPTSRARRLAERYRELLLDAVDRRLRRAGAARRSRSRAGWTPRPCWRRPCT